MIKKENNKKKLDDNIFADTASEDVRYLENYIEEFSRFLPLPFCLLAPNKTIIDINYAFKEFCGFDELDILGQNVSVLFKSKQRIAALFRSLEQGHKIKNREMDLLAKKRKPIKVSVSIASRKDNRGNLLGYFLAFFDIDELKRLQNNLEDKVKERTQKLEQEKRKILAIISNLVDPVIVVDAEDRLALINHAATTMLKIKEKDVGKKIISKNRRFSFKNFDKLVNIKFNVKEIETDADGLARVEEIIVNPAGKGEVNSPFLSGYSKYNSENIIYKVITAPVKYGKKLGYMKIFYDLTREKLIDQMKSEFISIAAHQLRTPLSAIKWSIRMVLDKEMGELNDAQEQILYKGYRSNERIIRLVNDMLNVSRIEEGRFHYVFAEHDLAEIVKNCISNSRNNIDARKIKLKINLSENFPKVSADKEKLSLAIQNILDNAVKYTPEYGNIAISLKAEKNNLCLSVKDNGVGIPPKDKSRIFSKFSRGENVVRMQTEGSGLGLYIVKNIVSKHKGKIEIKSQEGKGTEVIISLPLKS